MIKSWITLMLLLATAITHAQTTMTLVDHGSSSYTIVVDTEHPNAEESALVLQHYIFAISGVTVPIRAAHQGDTTAVLYMGRPVVNMLPEEYRVRAHPQGIDFSGKERSLLTAVYQFIEQVWGARKWYTGRQHTFLPQLQKLTFPTALALQGSPAFDFREVHAPIEADREYLDWHGLHHLEQKWGLWGHTFNKLIPAKTYFHSHPEYFSFFNGRRQPNQLCLSNPEVQHLVEEELKKAFADNPAAAYWSISPNDDVGYCECAHCAAVDAQEGGPQGSLIRFVNRIAETFPEQKFTTLAYTYSANPPLMTRAAPNVYVMLSNIDAQKTLSVAEEPSAAPFRRQLERWKTKADHVFIWDYYTQFTNYLAPFPVEGTLQPALAYYHQEDVQGVFAQLSGHTYGDMVELRAYVLAKLLWNPLQDENALVQQFLDGFYGAAAPFVYQYLQERRAAVEQQQVALQIYGSPIDNHRDFLSPASLDRYSMLMDKAEAAVEGQPELEARLARVRLGQDYVQLQQAKFFGLEQHGVFVQEKKKWVPRYGIQQRVARFVQSLDTAGVQEIAEGSLTPADYAQTWREIFDRGVRPNKARGAAVELAFPFVADFPAKGINTLTDGIGGQLDFSYNWLLFYNQPLEATLTLAKALTADSLSLSFLQDARHWIFHPQQVSVYLLQKGKADKLLYEAAFEMPEEDYQVSTFNLSIPLQGHSIRALKIVARPFADLPAWRYHRSKKVALAIDEFWIQ